MLFFIRSKKKGEEYWSGKEFSPIGAKLYSSFLDAAHALESYWFINHDLGLNEQFDHRQLIIVPVEQDSKEYRELLAFGKIRW